MSNIGGLVVNLPRDSLYTPTDKTLLYVTEEQLANCPSIFVHTIFLTAHLMTAIFHTIPFITQRGERYEKTIGFKDPLDRSVKQK